MLTRMNARSPQRRRAPQSRPRPPAALEAKGRPPPPRHVGRGEKSDGRSTAIWSEATAKIARLVKMAVTARAYSSQANPDAARAVGRGQRQR